jgi:hypothetical protein
VVISKTGFTGDSQRRAAHEFLQTVPTVYDVSTWISACDGRRAFTNRVVVLFCSDAEDAEWLSQLAQRVRMMLGTGTAMVAIDAHGRL